MITKCKNLGDLISHGIPGVSTVQEILAGTQRTYTSDQIDQMAQSVAAALLEKGFGYQDPIAVVGANSMEFLISYLGILKLGAVAVLISASKTSAQIENILKHSNTKLVFSDQIIDVDIPIIDLRQDFERLFDKQTFVSYQPEPDDTALIMYTSGSGGQSKGVLITHTAALHKFLDLRHSPSGKTLLASSMCNASALRGLENCLWRKQPVIFFDKFHSRSYLQAIHDHQVTRLIGVPTMFLMLDKESQLISTLNLDCVHSIVLAGAPVDKNACDVIKKIFSNADIIVVYGSTEGGPGIFGGHPTLPTPSGSVGYPKPDIEYRLVDGVLQIRHPGMMKGYLDKSQPFTEDGFYITNDIFTVDDQGFYYFVARSDDMFKCGGNKIYPGEIEQVLGLHPMVSECLVIPVEDSVKGAKPYAFVVLKNATHTTADELIQFLSKQLAHYLIPRQIWIIDHMPLNSANKIDRQQLLCLAQHNLQIQHQGPA